MDKLLSGRRVLVVEDEMMVLMLIEDMLAEIRSANVCARGEVRHRRIGARHKGCDRRSRNLIFGNSKCYPISAASLGHGKANKLTRVKTLTFTF
jgi:hypothetical protein